MSRKNSAPTDTKKCKACLTDIPRVASKCYKCGSSQGMHACHILLIVFLVLFLGLPFLAGFLLPIFGYASRMSDLEQVPSVETQSTQEEVPAE
jgi:hypothetical protein